MSNSKVGVRAIPFKTSGGRMEDFTQPPNTHFYFLFPLPTKDPKWNTPYEFEFQV